MTEEILIRCGNWMVNFLGEYFQANSGTIEAFETRFFPYGAPQRIPLTEDVLALCAQKHISESTPDFWSITWGTNGVVIIKWMPQYGLFGLELGKGRYKPMKYVDQLQNLFLDITETQLQINLHDLHPASQQ